MDPYGGRPALQGGRDGRPVSPNALDDGFRRLRPIARCEADRLSVYRREIGSGSGIEPGFRADSRAALRRLRQCTNRWAAVYGPRSRNGGEPGDPDDLARRLERPDQARPRPD